MADYWSATISSLGKLIEKPSLTEERLTKPPFRFLRDIVASLIKSTGFPAGLYTDEEMDVENLKEKPARVAWVKKIIDATSYTIGQSVSANPAKVVAGSDPEQTNEWLQLLAQAATAPKGDQEKGVKKALAKADSKSEKKKDGDGKEKGKKEKDDKAGEGKGDKADAKGKDKDKDGKADGKDKKDRKDKDGEKDKPAKDGKEKKDKKDKKDKDEPPPPPEPIDPHAAMAAKLRPSTSRAGPPVKKDAVERVDATAESVSAQSHAQGVIRGGGGDGGDDDDDDEREIDVAAQHIREDAAALGAGNGDPAALGAADIENARAKMQIVREGEDDGLILTGTRKAKPRSTFDDEVHRMRQSLQSLVNSTQPLGKAMDYIQEDIDSMARELNLLRNETTQQNVLFLEQQKATDDATAPLHNKLMDLETDIGEQNQRTVLLKANIVANDETVKVLLRMVVMPDME